MPLYLTEQNVADLFEMRDAIEAVESVLKATPRDRRPTSPVVESAPEAPRSMS
jgi:ornithine cyclodeaminase/alanine dehydrogenase-like protein (mu-crystallin family)